MSKPPFRRIRNVLIVSLVMAVLSAALPPAAANDPGAGPSPSRESRDELLGRRTQTSKTFLNDDGTLTTELHSAPIHYQTPGGRWRPIDSKVVASERSGYTWRNAANSFRASFRDQLSDDHLRFESGEVDVTLGLHDAAPARGRASRGVVRYESVRPGTSLEYEILAEGVKETLVLEDRSAPSKFSFSLHQTGAPLQARERKDGSWAFFAGDAPEPAFLLAAPSLLEAAAGTAEGDVTQTRPSPTPAASPSEPAAASPSPSPSATNSAASPSPEESPATGSTPAAQEGNGQPEPTPTDSQASQEAATSAPAPTEEPEVGQEDAFEPISAERAGAKLQVSGRGNDFIVDLSVDPAWLEAPERSFPILLDPTITIQPGSEDATFYANCANCLPYTGERVYMGTSDSYVYRTGMLFDLSALPVAANITQATLRTNSDGTCIDVKGPSCGGNDHQIDLHRMTAPWSTSTTSGEVRFDSTVLSSWSLPAKTYYNPSDWDATAAVKGWVSGASANHGFLLKRSTEPLGASGIAPYGRRTTYKERRPRLEVTYDGVLHLPPEILHSNGAELRWTSYQVPSGGTFDRYEVHRSSSPGFETSAATLLATIRDIDVTTYRDTTAAPDKAFSYKIVTHAGTAPSPSIEQTVTLPSDGKAILRIQPDASTGRDTYLEHSTDGKEKDAECRNNGKAGPLWVGLDLDAFNPLLRRGLISFDLSRIPRGATVTNAKMSLYHSDSNSTAGTIDMHAVSRSWKEGASVGSCTGEGASWNRAEAGVPWSSPGADFDSTPAASVSFPAGDGAGWHDFVFTGTAQKWVDGTAPNLGLLLKQADETLNLGRGVYYIAADSSDSTTWPKLEVEFQEDVHAKAPSVTLSSPVDGATVRGSNVDVTAAASDDRRVDKVEFFVDGTSIAIDTTAPYGTAWNSTTVANGAHILTAKATDDAGNVGTAAPVDITVSNSAPPTVSLTAPASGATVSGTVAVRADATDDVAVTKVDFYADDVRFAEDATAPYEVSWDTLDQQLPAYDGVHVLVAKAVDDDGQVVSSAPVDVTVANTAGTKFRADFSSTAVPQSVDYDPAASAQKTHPVDVTVTNRSDATWLASDVVVRPRWISPDPAVAPVDGTAVALGTDLGAGASRMVRIDVEPPALASGTDRAQYWLRFDLYSNASSAWFASKGNKPLDNPVIVNKILRTALGLERHHHYVGGELGAGVSHLANVANGNSLLQWTPFSSPGRGLSTVVGLTYNSLEDHSESPVGNNFSLAVSTLTRFGLPLDIHPNKADEIAGRAKAYISFTDGDGSTHTFTRNSNGGWDEPPGVHLYLREYSTTDPSKKWALTRPDRVTFFYDADGFPTGVEDKNRNRLGFTLEDVAAAEDPGGVRKRITKVTDASGQGSAAAANRSFTIDYYSKAEAKKPQVRGKIEKITDHDGSALSFDYYDDGNLLRVVQQGGTTAAGAHLELRSIVFTYTTSDGSGPAIPAASDRVSPDPKTSNQSTRLFSVRDPRGHESTFTYFGPGSSLDRWKLKTRTDRDGAVTSFAYDITNRVTTVSEPLSRVSNYAYDAEGRVTKVTDPKSRDTLLEWTNELQVKKMTEPGGAYTEFSYNGNGYMTDQRVLTGKGADGSVGTTDDVIAHTQLTYENLAVDAADVELNWKAGRTIPHISQLASVTKPNGVASSNVAEDYQWSFSYDSSGNLTKTTEPEGSPRYSTAYTPNPDGTIATITDARGNATSFEYDRNGLISKVTDPLGRVTRMGYDDDGLLRWIQDPDHASFSGDDPTAYRRYFYYDSFHRLGAQSQPKMTSAQADLVWSVAEFDANDNLIAQHAPAYGHGLSRGPRSDMTYDDMDRLVSSSNPQGEKTTVSYDGAGRTSAVVTPKGNAAASTSDKDHATFYSYDVLDRVVTETRYDTAGTATPLNTHFCYDTAGDLVSVTAPKAELASPDCSGSPSHTTRFGYDMAHRRVSSTDPLGHKSETDYDLNGQVRATIDAALTRTTHDYDQRGLLTKTTQPLNGTRDVVTRYEHDAVGNLVKAISPRAHDSGSDALATRYFYDAANQLEKTQLPSNGQAGDTFFVYRGYDANGRVTKTTLPDPAGSLSQVPADKVTTVSYFDTGWVASHNDHVNGKITFDYNARGQQTYRAHKDSPERWEYASDGMMTAHTDPVRDGVGGQSVTYDYDANNNLDFATDSSGRVTPGVDAVEIDLVYDTLDRIAKVRHRKGSQAWRYSSSTYDLNSNVIERIDDGVEGEAGSGTKHTYTYDSADWLKTQLDFLDNGCRKINNAFAPTGWEDTRVIRRSALACSDVNAVFTAKQSTDWDHFANGKLKTVTTRSGTLSGNVIERHSVDYVKNATYFNGHRVSDEFFRSAPGDEQSPKCGSAAPCTATYDYDARDRLTQEFPGHGSATTYKVDEVGNVTEKTVGSAAAIVYKYSGSRLDTITDTGSGSSRRYLYDAGNLECVVAGSYSGSCDDARGTSDLFESYSYDYLDRLAAFEKYSGGTKTDETTYIYDPLDRVLSQTEAHGLGGTAPKKRTTTFSYVGVSSLVAQEDFTGDRTSDTKTYSYDVYGHRIGMSDKKTGAATPDEYTYGYDVHGSTSMLLKDPGAATEGVTVKATYGYDAYGNEDKALTSDTEEVNGTNANNDPLNAFRYTAKRFDTGSQSLDMGARRFSPDTTRFLQPDVYRGALSNLGLTADPLTQNRYSLAGGNPVSFVETDGHMVVADGGGGGAKTPSPDGWAAGAIGEGGSSGGGSSSGTSSQGGGYDFVRDTLGVRRRQLLAYAVYGLLKPPDSERNIGFHQALDMFGLVPGAGEPVDLIHGAIYMAQGDFGEGASYAGAAVPFLGAGKVVAKYGDELGTVAGKSDEAGSLTRAVRQLGTKGVGDSAAQGGVYVLRDPVTGQVVRTGRSNNLARRQLEHARDSGLRDYQFGVAFRTDSYTQQRGLEQLVHDAFGPALNRINPISARNPRLGSYLDEAESFLRTYGT